MTEFTWPIRLAKPARKTRGRHRGAHAARGRQRRQRTNWLSKAIRVHITELREVWAIIRAPREPGEHGAPSLSFFDAETLRLFALINKDVKAKVPALLTDQIADTLGAIRRVAATNPVGLRTALAATAEMTDALGAVVFNAQARAAGRWVG